MNQQVVGGKRAYMRRQLLLTHLTYVKGARNSKFNIATDGVIMSLILGTDLEDFVDLSGVILLR